jgi:hypothetical protein
VPRVPNPFPRAAAAARARSQLRLRSRRRLSEDKLTRRRSAHGSSPRVPCARAVARPDRRAVGPARDATVMRQPAHRPRCSVREGEPPINSARRRRSSSHWRCEHRDDLLSLPSVAPAPTRTVVEGGRASPLDASRGATGNYLVRTTVRPKNVAARPRHPAPGFSYGIPVIVTRQTLRPVTLAGSWGEPTDAARPFLRACVARRPTPIGRRVFPLSGRRARRRSAPPWQAKRRQSASSWSTITWTP